MNKIDTQPAEQPWKYDMHGYSGVREGPLLGRQEELERLDAWARGSDTDRGEETSPIMVVEAFGGMGKSALTWEWFQKRTLPALGEETCRFWWSFYGRRAGFSRFERRLLATLKQAPMEEIDCIHDRPAIQDRILEYLETRPVLIVMDGLERELIDYRAALVDDPGRIDLSALFGAATEEEYSGAASTAESKGFREGRYMHDQEAGRFLDDLRSLSKSRILVSTRHMPADWEEPNGIPKPGIERIPLAGLTTQPGLLLLKEMGVHGSLAHQERLIEDVEGHPLILRAVGGAIARATEAMGDIGRYHLCHPEFTPFDVDITERRTHILKYAFRDLSPAAVEILSFVALDDSALDYELLRRLCVGDEGACVSEADFAETLRELRDVRGLVEQDADRDLYSMHPVIRGFTWKQLPLEQQASAAKRLERQDVATLAADRGERHVSGGNPIEDEDHLQTLFEFHLDERPTGRGRLSAGPTELQRLRQRVYRCRMVQHEHDKAWESLTPLLSIWNKCALYGEMVGYLTEFFDGDVSAGGHESRLTCKLKDADNERIALERLADSWRKRGHSDIAVKLCDLGIERYGSAGFFAVRGLSLLHLGRRHEAARDLTTHLEMARRLSAEASGNEDSRKETAQAGAFEVSERHALRMVAYAMAEGGQIAVARIALARSARVARSAEIDKPGRGSDKIWDSGEIEFQFAARWEVLASLPYHQVEHAKASLPHRLHLFDESINVSVILSSKYWLAEGFRERHLADEALAIWTELAEDYRRRGLFNSTANYHFRRARLLVEQGRQDAAESALKLGIRFSGDLPVIGIRASRLITVAVLNERFGDRQPAIDAARGVPRLCEGHISRGWPPLEQAIEILERMGDDFAQHCCFPEPIEWDMAVINPKDVHHVDPGLIPPPEWT